MNPDFEKTWNNLGLTLVKMGKYREAVEAYDKALEIKPGYKGAKENRGKAVKKTRKFRKSDPR